MRIAKPTRLHGDPAQLEAALGGIVVETGGFDLVIDPFFDLYLPGVLPAVRRGGVYVTCGFEDQLRQSADSKSMVDLMTLAIVNNLRLAGNCLGQTEDLTRALDDHVHGRFEVLIDSVHDDIGTYIHRWLDASDRSGKVVFRNPED